MDWLDSLKLLVQKGFNTAAGYVGLKLTLIDGDPTSGPGVTAIGIGAVLLIWVASIEYFAWSRSAGIMAGVTKRSLEELVRIIESRPGGRSDSK